MSAVVSILKMQTRSVIGFAATFLVTVTFLLLPGVSTIHADASPAPGNCISSPTVSCDQWVPAGPSMDQLKITIYSSAATELNSLYPAYGVAGAGDLPDIALDLAHFNAICPAGSGYYVTNSGTSCSFVAGTNYGYPTTWTRVITSTSTLSSSFSPLNMWTSTPATAGTIRWGFSSGPTTLRVNPYSFNPTVQNFSLVRQVYDSLYRVNPLDSTQVLDWMTVFHTIPTTLGYSPPSGTVETVRNTLWSNMYSQDGHNVTAYDVAFSYLSLIAASAPQATRAGLSCMGKACLITGITVLNYRQFDINLGSSTFNIGNLGNLTIVPGRFWTTSLPSSWDSAVKTCSIPAAPCTGEYNLTATTPMCYTDTTFNCAFPIALMKADSAKTASSWDPISSSSSNFIGSGPWECLSSAGVLGTGCSSSGTQSPGTNGSFNFTRFGKGYQPGACLTTCYFRSSGVLALWLWLGYTGDPSNDLAVLSAVASCWQQAAIPLGGTGVCAHWQQGIGTGGATITGGTLGCPVGSTCGVPVGIPQWDAAKEMYGINWVSPFIWASSTPPTGIAVLPPVLYEGTAVLTPASTAGCTTPYPVGGYDC